MIHFSHFIDQRVAIDSDGIEVESKHCVHHDSFDDSKFATIEHLADIEAKFVFDDDPKGSYFFNDYASIWFLDR